MSEEKARENFASETASKIRENIMRPVSIGDAMLILGRSEQIVNNTEK